jgi:hypothetical protein
MNKHTGKSYILRPPSILTYTLDDRSQTNNIKIYILTNGTIN